jgi:ribose transport system substrate-binding protein
MRTRVMALLACLVLAWIGGGLEVARAGGPVVIGIPTVWRGSQFHAALVSEAERVAAARGAKTAVVDCQGNAGRQESAVKTFVRDGVAGILISPLDDSLVPVIEAAARAGIPVAVVDGPLSTDKALVQVLSDNVQGGRLAAEFIIERLGNRGSVIELEGRSESIAARERKAGFDEVMSGSNVQIVASVSARWERAAAFNTMKGLIRKFPDFDAVFAANDEMIIGAIDAMGAAHVDPRTKVTVGFDATPDAMKFLKAGKLRATIDQYGCKQAKQAVEALMDFIENQARPSEPVVRVPPGLVTNAP